MDVEKVVLPKADELENENLVYKDAEEAAASEPHDNSAKDVMWAVLFLCAVLATMVFVPMGWNHAHIEQPDQTTPVDVEKNIPHVEPADFEKLFVVAVVALLVCLTLEMGWIYLMRHRSEQLIWVALGLNLSLMAISCGFLAYKGATGPALFALFFLAIMCAYTYFVRRRIPLAGLMLKTSSTVLKEYPAMLIPAFSSIFVVTGVMCLLGLAAYSTTGFGNVYIMEGALFYLVFVWFWCTQVTKNIVHVTSAGTYGTYYFSKNLGMPPNPTLSSFKRATTTSFGSICLGSLVIAVIQTLRFLCSTARSGGKRNFVTMVAECILGCIERMARYVNVYAFTQVALYGKPYCEAARHTFELLRTQGFDMIINDDLTGFVLGLVVMSSALCGTFAGALMGLAMYDDEALVAAAAGVGFVVGFAVGAPVVEVLRSGIAALFVSFAMSPAEMKENLPSIFDSLSSAYGACNVGIFSVTARQ